jgi:L-ascorbate metabolism protein UlaG (beta-lactamase superfamily)
MKYLALFCAFVAAVTVAACAPKTTNSDPNVESFKAKGGNVDIACINHGSISVTYKDYIIQIDPVNSYGGKQLGYESLPKADLILITHEHGDHYNKETIELLSKDDTRIIVNGTVHGLLGYGEVMANGDKTEAGKGIKIDATPAYNTTEGRTQFHPKGNGNGYLLTIGGLRVFVSGDSEDIEEYAQLKDIDVAFLSANQPYTMTVEQCIHAAKVINPKVLVPYHLGNTDMQAIKDGLEGTGIDVRLHETLR